MFSSKYHLPHNAVRIDEFNHMLNSIDLNKELYTYKELRLLFLQKHIASNKLSDFHNKYDQNYASSLFCTLLNRIIKLDSPHS